jgi:hypothetical protein
MVLRHIARSPREPGFLAPVVRELRQIANLASASGGQDHTPSSSASAPFVRTKNSRAALLRPSQPASRPVTIGQNVPLSSRRDAGSMPIILKNGSEIFLSRGLDSRISLEMPREFRFFARAFFDPGDSSAAAGSCSKRPRRTNQSHQRLPSSWPGLSRPSTSLARRKTWMPGTRPGMTSRWGDEPSKSNRTSGAISHLPERSTIPGVCQPPFLA